MLLALGHLRHDVIMDSAGVNRTWLDVPYRDKDEAKAAGARWDSAAKRWYAPRPGMADLQRWAARPDIPQLLPGEDREFGSGLFVDLVPSSCWFTNVRSCVSQQDWERLRRMLRTRANHQCEICGVGEDRESKRWLEAHERWHFDDVTSTQTLRRLILLCSPCHRTTHFGLAQIHGEAENALEHLWIVAEMTPRQADQHIEQAFQKWRRRSARKWHLDLSMLTDAGVAVAPPPEAGDRVNVAAAKLQADQANAAERDIAPASPPATMAWPSAPPISLSPDPQHGRKTRAWRTWFRKR